MQNRYQYTGAALVWVLLLLGLQSCEPDANKGNDFVLDLPEKSEIIGLATNIQLGDGIKKDGITKVHLEDFFKTPKHIDSIGTDTDKLRYTHYADEQHIDVEVDEDLPFLSNLAIRVAGHTYDFLVRKSLRQKVNLSYNVPSTSNNRKIQVKGAFNNWATTDLKGNAIQLSLNPGRYHYLFIVNGKETLDPMNPIKESNGMGGFNSVLVVEKVENKDLPFIYPKSEEYGSVRVGFTNKPQKVYAYWENYNLPVIMTDDYALIDIPANADDMPRSFLRIYAYNEKGISNDLKIPLHHGRALLDVKNLDRMDKEAMIMYFTLIDRFNNGNKDNDEPVKDERLSPIQNYMGGDLAGITQKIKDGYFKDLGMNTIWLSPITQNPTKAYQEWPEPRRWYSGYHGYWPISSSQVDHRFGTDAELHELVKTAHDNDMNILLDYVCNHVHEEHPIYKKHPEWATPLNLPNGKKNIRIWDEQRLTTWFDEFMPTLDLSNPDVIKLQADSAFYWLKEYNLDGYRHDAAKHIPEEFWRHLTHRIKTEIIEEEGRPVYQIGETYGGHELIASYISSGMMDSQFDFNLHFTARDVFAKGDQPLDIIGNAMQESFGYYGYHSTMGNMSGNHDQTRFMGLASGAVSFDEDAKEAGYARKIEVKDKAAFAKFANMHAFLMSIPGVPVVYYGDEMGMVGASDPDNRRMMRFEGLNEDEEKLRNTVKQLTNYRKNSLALIYGDTYMLRSDKDVLAYARIYFDEVVIAVFSNTTDAPIKLELPDFLKDKKYQSALGRSDLSLTENTLSVKIPKGGFDYISF